MVGAKSRKLYRGVIPDVLILGVTGRGRRRRMGFVGEKGPDERRTSKTK